MMQSDSLQLLSFTLEQNVYGVDITKVQEIRAVGSIRSLPNTPGHCVGIIDFRQAMVPILDLREMFGYPNTNIDKHTVVIITSVALDTGTMLVGAIVDAVSDVISVNPDDLKATPSMGASINTDYISGMFKHDDVIVVVLNMEAILQTEDVDALKRLVDSNKDVSQLE